MHNEFVIVGPRDLQEAIAGAGDARDVMRKIAASGQRFVSRGDGSGTHLREQSLWRSAGIAADRSFILVAGTGMGATLERASTERAFTLTDRSTYLARRKALDLAILFQGDPALRNDYSVLEPVSRAANREGAHALELFLRSPEGRSLIGGFGVAEVGEPLFTPEP